MAVRPSGRALGTLDADDLEGADGALAARVTSLQELEGEVEGGSEVRRLVAQPEIERRVSVEALSHLVPRVPGRMARWFGHARLLSPLTLDVRGLSYHHPDEERRPRPGRHSYG
jgi:hypothetical protein